MKLKKFAAMMLAGVMAVSMLAGCAEGGKKEDDNKEPVATGMTAKVIAALDEDTTKIVDFAASSSLEAALKKAVQNVGSDVVGNASFASDVMAELTKVNPDLTSTVFVGGTDANDKKEQSYTCVQLLNDSDIGASEEYAAAKLADMVEATKANGATVLAKTGTYSQDYTKDNDTYYYTFDYTGDIAVVEVTNAVTGQTSYISAVTITRTATKVVK